MPTPRLLSLLPFLFLAAACHSHTHHPSTTRLAVARPTTHPATRPAPPLIDLRHGTGSFPLGPQKIDTASSLTSSLHDGYLRRLIPSTPDFLTLQGTLPHLDLLRINVSDAHVRPGYVPAEFGKDPKTDRTIIIHRLEYLADPLHYETASARISLIADDAQLDLLHDAKHTQGLILAGARKGRFELHISHADLDKFLTSPQSSDITVLRTTFSLTSDSPHSLTATLDVRARWLLLPLTLSFHGHLTSSPDGTVTFSDLSITGYDPGGLLVAAIANPELHKMNGTSQPALSFPDPQTHLTDVRFDTSDGLTFTADFARQ